MEHINVKQRTVGDKEYYYLTPQEGWRLYNTISQRYYSEALTESLDGWTAVAA